MALPVNGSTHLTPAYYSFCRPRKDEKLSWLTCSGSFTHIRGHPSAAGRAQDKESSPVTDRRSTTVLRHQRWVCCVFSLLGKVKVKVKVLPPVLWTWWLGSRKSIRPVDTYTHTFNGLLSGTTGKVKPIWILLKQETVSGSGISWAICKSAPRSRQITTPATHHSVFYRPDDLPAAQPTASKQPNLQ